MLLKALSTLQQTYGQCDNDATTHSFENNLYDKTETSCQIDSNKVSNYYLKPDACKCVTYEAIRAAAPPQQP